MSTRDPYATQNLMIYRGFRVREGTMDEYIVNEIGSYKSLVLTSEDIVLDVGANIGTFSKHAHSQGVQKVFAIEPDPENYALLIKNVEACHNVTCLNHAVVGGDSIQPVTLYKNTGRNKGLHSTIPTRGREEIQVSVLRWHRCLALWRPTKIKIDCEGAEYTFLEPEKINEECKGLIIEYNLSRKGEQEKGQAMHSRFLAEGWDCVRQPRFGTRAWATLASYRR